MLDFIFGGQTFDPNAQLSPSFKLKDLSVTSTGITNNPTEASFNNLKRLASELDYLKSVIGPFTVASAYRNQDVNEAVGGSSTSKHMTGEAADIVPTSGNAFLYFSDILKNDNVRNRFGEISLKKPQNAIHLTLPYYNSSGKYVQNSPRIADGNPLIYMSMTQNEIANFIQNPYGTPTASVPVVQAGIPWYLKMTMIGTIASMGIFLLKQRSKS